MVQTEAYIEKVYAGVLGKIIGVYLGRPFEGWTYERIMTELGEVWYYVHENLGKKLVVTDDDISGTFAFLRALEDYAEKGSSITAEDIGNTWLNYLIEDESILWWGGKGISTEHTAYLRLKEGYRPPESGSIALNGRTVAEQIGAQIFIEGWGLVSPLDPERAVEFAGKAGSVSHDGESVIAAQMIAAMVALAFAEKDAVTLVGEGAGYINQDSFTRRIIDDLLNIREKQPDWRMAREHIAEHYGYDKYGGGCHIVPNHAVDLLGLLYSEDNFQRGLMITNTAGWDTDCNSANVGCILGLLHGLEGIQDGADFRGPVADRMYITTADGGSVITDAVRETYRIVNITRRLHGEAPTKSDKGARFNFSLPGAVQGFTADPVSGARVRIENVESGGKRLLRIAYSNLNPASDIKVATPTFIPRDDLEMEGYRLAACPTLYPGQIIRAAVKAEDCGTVSIALIVQTYAQSETGATEYVTHTGAPKVMSDGESAVLEFEAPDTRGAPIATVGLNISVPDSWTAGGGRGSLLVDWINWDGTPSAVLCGSGDGTHSHRAWVVSADKSWIRADVLMLAKHWEPGFAIQGTRDWANYRVTAEVTPRLFERGGVVVAFQGLLRYISCVLTDEQTLEIASHVDGKRTVLASAPFSFVWNEPVTMVAELRNTELSVRVGETARVKTDTVPSALVSGAAGITVVKGSITSSRFEIEAL